MKVILSRKGFDSSNGGIVSPIFEDGTMISFPIPSDDPDTFDDLHYKGTLYSVILKDLNYKGDRYCHIDPDLDLNRRVSTIESWVPAFGQINSSASYLKNASIDVGDLFLFFGNFHSITEKKGHYKYTRKTGDFYKDNDLQVIWGYLQVGKIVSNPDEQKELYWHPHSIDRRTNNSSNVIYKASECLSFNINMPGAGCLSFDIKRVLTVKNGNKATWKYNSVYDVDHIIGNRKNSANEPSEGIYYSGIWQELCLEESEECEKWAKSIVLD